MKDSQNLWELIQQAIREGDIAEFHRLQEQTRAARIKADKHNKALIYEPACPLCIRNNDATLWAHVRGEH